jgi:hypothetical protein
LDAQCIWPSNQNRERLIMGYCISLDEAVFFIAEKDKKAALKAIKAIAGDTSQMSGGSYEFGTGKSTRHYAWVSTGDLLAAKTLEAAMTEWRYCPETDEEGNISNIYFEGEKIGDETALFKALAPFVKSGSYIQMHGEDGSIWRWCFNDGKFEEKSARMVWE